MEHQEAASRQRIVDNIAKHGCHLVIIPEDNYMPAFVYTIGLYERFGHPELIMFGLKTDVMSSLLNDACQQIMEGNRFEAGVLYEQFLKTNYIQFLTVDKAHYKDNVGYAKWYYGSFDFPLLQFVWPDMSGRFPWEENFVAEWKFRQPLLDRNMDFKFYEPRNLGVFTSKEVLDGAPILFVYHNEDGDWQFHSSNNPHVEDAKLVSLETITKMDPSINDIHFLQYGGQAWRKSIADDWEY